MPNTILLKKNSAAGTAPTAGQLAAGELAINTADGRLFAKNAANAVVNLPVTSISGQAITPSSVGATGNVAGSTLTSSVAVGTAPLAVTSTTVCTNLNADTVDGQHASAFAPVVTVTSNTLNTGTTNLTAARAARYIYSFYGGAATINLPTTGAQANDVVQITATTVVSGTITISGSSSGTDTITAANQQYTYYRVSDSGGQWRKLAVDVHAHSGGDITTGTVANARLPTGNRISGYCAGIFFG